MRSPVLYLHQQPARHQITAALEKVDGKSAASIEDQWEQSRGRRGPNTGH